MFATIKSYFQEKLLKFVFFLKKEKKTILLGDFLKHVKLPLFEVFSREHVFPKDLVV